MIDERLREIPTNIETADLEERENLLSEKITQISLLYADKKYQEIKKDKPGYKFHEALTEFTPIIGRIKKMLYRVEGFSPKKNKEKLDMFFDIFFEKLDSLYEEDGLNMDKVLELIKTAKDSIRQYLGVENSKMLDPRERSRDKKVAKLLSYNDVESVNSGWSELEKLGFSKFDKLTEVHVRDFYKTGEKHLGTELIKSDFAEIAVHIIDQSPSTVAVVGNSWIMSTPVARALGFMKMPEDNKNKKENIQPTWLQFIDKDGQINKKRFDKFCETGDLPFNNVKAYIPVEDFLRKYLPPSRRGKIVLKELRKDCEPIKAEMLLLMESLNKEWADLLINDGEGKVGINTESPDPFKGFINGKNVQKLCEIFGLEDGDLFIDFLSKMYFKKIPWKDFKKNIEDKDFLDRIGKKIFDSLYIEKEIFID